LVSCNAQHYKFVNRTTKVEPTPEDTKVDKEEEEPQKESNFKYSVFFFFVFIFILVFWEDKTI